MQTATGNLSDEKKMPQLFTHEKKMLIHEIPTKVRWHEDTMALDSRDLRWSLAHEIKTLTEHI